LNPGTLPIGELAAIGAAMIWASTSIIFTHAGRVSTPVAVNTFKTVAAVFLFAVVLWIRDGVPYGVGIAPMDVTLLALSGLAGLSFGDSLLFRGFVTIGTRRAMLVFALNPVFGAVGGYIFLGEQIGTRGMIGMAIALAGVVMVIGEKRRAAPDGLTYTGPEAPGGRQRFPRPALDRRTQITGILFALGGGLGQAVGALLAKAPLERVATAEATQIRAAAGGLGLLVIGALGGRLTHWTRLIIRGRILAQLALASLFGPFIGLWLMVISLDRAPTGIALTLLSTSPIWLLPLGAWFQDDRPSLHEVAGALIAIAGVALLVFR